MDYNFNNPETSRLESIIEKNPDEKIITKNMMVFGTDIDQISTFLTMSLEDFHNS